jgi:5'(3')-deoxyribonucleotidase
MQIFVDLDEVLADFLSGACAAHDLTPAEMTKEFGGEYWEGPEFWEPIEELGYAFWLGLKPLPWAGALMEVAREFASHPSQVYLLTTPSHCPFSYAGKAKWVKKHLGLSPWDHLIPFRKKDMLAGPGRVLIDDLPANVMMWRAAGGSAVLFPHVRNELRHHVDMRNQVGYVRAALAEIQRAAYETTTHHPAPPGVGHSY